MNNLISEMCVFQHDCVVLLKIYHRNLSTECDVDERHLKFYFHELIKTMTVECIERKYSICSK